MKYISELRVIWVWVWHVTFLMHTTSSQFWKETATTSGRLHASKHTIIHTTTEYQVSHNLASHGQGQVQSRTKMSECDYCQWIQIVSNEINKCLGRNIYMFVVGHIEFDILYFPGYMEKCLLHEGTFFTYLWRDKEWKYQLMNYWLLRMEPPISEDIILGKVHVLNSYGHSFASFYSNSRYQW